MRCLLGLTATATLSTALDIARHLNITDEDGIAVRSAAVPPNLNLSVSMDREKDQVYYYFPHFISVYSASIRVFFIFTGFSVLVERRQVWMSRLNHCVLHQKRGDGSSCCTGPNMSAGGASERKPTY